MKPNEMQIDSIVFLLLIVAANHVIFGENFQEIGACYYSNGAYGDNNLTLVCVEKVENNSIFVNDPEPTCLNQPDESFQRYWIGTINFQSCRQPHIPNNTFELYVNVHTVNISYLGLISLRAEDFVNADNVKNLIVSHNDFVELPRDQLQNVYNLIHVDFSFNRITTINANSFHIDNHLKYLNVGHNSISELNALSLVNLLEVEHFLISHNRFTEISTFIFHKMKNLIKIDFSYNEISNINIFAFSGHFALETLNLSNNQLTVLERKFFADDNLKSLFHLDLSSNLIAEIKPGTFSTLINLNTLDLSHNKLKILNADILPMSSHYLETLSIGNNQMQQFIGFTNSRIPKAKILGISEFACSNFNNLFKSLTWKHVDDVSKLIHCKTIDEGTVFNDYFESSAQRRQDEENEAEHTHVERERHIDGSSMTSLLVTAWINAICMITIVATLFWFIVHKRLQKASVFTGVSYHRYNGEPTSTIENTGQ